MVNADSSLNKMYLKIINRSERLAVGFETSPFKRREGY